MTVSLSEPLDTLPLDGDGKRPRPFAVIDIGSNSVRLVVFARLSRAPLTIFNEKVLCGLGRFKEGQRELTVEAMDRALSTIGRFAHLLRVMQVDDVAAVATAAVRDADNGDEFCRRIQDTTGISVRILTGREEAHFAAQGVVAANPAVSGLAGDLGGGSLELVSLRDGEIGDGVTLEIGALGISKQLAGSNYEATCRRVDEALDRLDWLPGMKGADLHAVGGAWRALGRMQMARENTKLRIVHGYALPARKLDAICELVARQSAESLRWIGGVAEERREALPAAALVMSRLLKRSGMSRVIFSAFGLREGLVFDHLDEAARREDPLIIACREVAERTARFPIHGEALSDWLEPVFPGEAADRHRLRLAACLLSDIGWRVHPDYRADHAVEEVLSAPTVGLVHSDRMLLALAVGFRFARERSSEAVRNLAADFGEDDLSWARRVGFGLRLAHTLSGGTLEILQQSRLRIDDGQLVLTIDPGAEDIVGEVIVRRLRRMARAIGLEHRIELPAAG